MSAKEWERKSVLELVTGGRLTLVAASRRLHLSYRQTLRVHQRYVEQGDASLVHRRRGQPSNRGYPDAFRDQVVKRYRARYAGDEFGPTLASEKLAGDGLVVDHETLRRWLLASGDWKKRRRRRAHRTRRKRKPHFGELVQMDGSFHNWFGRDRDKACLMNMVDDATGATAAAMRLLWQWIERYGIPVALYTDKRTVYITNREPRIEEQLADEEPMTAFGKRRTLQRRLPGPVPQRTLPAAHHHDREREQTARQRLHRLAQREVCPGTPLAGRLPPSRAQRSQPSRRVQHRRGASGSKRLVHPAQQPALPNHQREHAAAQAQR